MDLAGAIVAMHEAAMSIDHRSGRAEDLPKAAALFCEAYFDLARRNGLTPAPVTPAEMMPAYTHLLETGLFEVACEGDALRAFAMGFVRDDLFFLSMFWTQPGKQKRGLGRPCLDRILAAARARGARTFSVWSSIDFAALGSYLKRGMRPVGPVLTFMGEPVVEQPDGELVPLAPGVAAALDAEVRGTPRRIDHAFFTETKQGFEVRRDGRSLGYFYAKGGRVGPAAWQAGEGSAVLRAGLHVAARETASVVMAVLGPSSEAIDAALGAGLKIVGTSHLLTSAPFGALDRYVPSGPALF